MKYNLLIQCSCSNGQTNIGVSPMRPLVRSKFVTGRVHYRLLLLLTIVLIQLALFPYEGRGILGRLYPSAMSDELGLFDLDMGSALSSEGNKL